MIPIWGDALDIQYCSYLEIEYVAALFSDRVCVYDRNSKELLLYAMGEFVSIAFYSNRLFLVTSNGEDKRTFFVEKYGEAELTDSQSMHNELSLYIYEVHSINIPERRGVTFVTRSLYNMDVAKRGLFSYYGYFNSYSTTPYHFYDSAALRDKKANFRFESLFSSDSFGTDFHYPGTIKRVSTSPPGQPYVSPFGCVNWGPAYTYSIDSSQFGVAYWDGTVFNSTVFSLTDLKTFALDGEHFLISYVSEYSLYEYNSTSKVYEKVSSFNSSAAALPSDQKNLLFDYAANVAVATAGRKFYTIDLSDGSYVTSNHPNTSRDLVSTSKYIFDGGVGKDKLLFYIKYPYTEYRTFNITQQTYSSNAVGDYFDKYIPIINGFLNNETVEGQIAADAVEAFSGGVCVFTRADTNYGGMFSPGMARFEIDPTTGDITLLDTDLDYLELANSTTMAAEKISYSMPIGPGRNRRTPYHRGVINLETPPPYMGGGGSAETDVTFYAAVADPTDISKGVLHVGIPPYTGAAEEFYQLSNFQTGKCMHWVDQVIDSVALQDYTIFAVVKAGQTYLLAFSTEFNWGDNTLLSRGGIIDDDVIRDLEEDASVTMPDQYLPYAERKSEPILSLNYVSSNSLVVHYVSGKSLVFGIGDLLE